LTLIRLTRRSLFDLSRFGTKVNELLIIGSYRKIALLISFTSLIVEEIAGGGRTTEATDVA
jgi:hypothetical protein